MRVLGIDPGIARVGWGVVEENKGKLKAINYACFETDSKEKVGIRLNKIHKEIKRVIKEHSPDLIIVEELFFNTNAKTAFVVGQARGVILLACSECTREALTYTPLQVKVTITGFGRAEKKEVGEKVKEMLKLKEVPKPDDTADALAVAITYILKEKLRKSSEKVENTSK